MFDAGHLAKTPVAMWMVIAGLVATAVVHEVLGWRIWVCALAAGLPAGLLMFLLLWAVCGWWARYTWNRRQRKRPLYHYD